MDKAEGEVAPELAGQRRAGEESTQETPEPVASRIDSDPRLANITEHVSQSFRLTFNRGAHSATFEFPSEPSDAIKADYRKRAEDTLDRLEAQETQELQDRRRPK